MSAVCSKGWGNRCAHARGPRCNCACAGKNHGSAHGGNFTAPAPRRRSSPASDAQEVMGLSTPPRSAPPAMRMAPVPSVPVRRQAFFRYTTDGRAFGRNSAADVRVYDRPDGARVLVATELDNNPGASVTNTIETLVDAAVKFFGLDRRRLTVIEHYPERGPRNDRLPATWDFVTFAAVEGGVSRGPSWKRATAAEVYFLTGDAAFAGVVVGVDMGRGDSWSATAPA